MVCIPCGPAPTWTRLLRCMVYNGGRDGFLTGVDARFAAQSPARARVYGEVAGRRWTVRPRRRSFTGRRGSALSRSTGRVLRLLANAAGEVARNTWRAEKPRQAQRNTRGRG